MRHRDVELSTVVVALLLAALAAGLFLTGCGDDTTSPGNRSPEITDLSADPDTVDPAGIAEITCSTDDPDGDDLAYTWESSKGTITGTGETVTWIGPIEAGTCTVAVAVADGEGGSDSEMVEVEVRGGTFLVETDTEVLAVDMSGNYYTFYAGISPKIEVVGTRIFFGPGGVQEISHSGTIINTIMKPPEAPAYYSTNFCALPDGGFVFAENSGDTLTFVTSTGAFIENVVMPEASSINQAINGVVVGNRLVISETGGQKLAQVDLTTRAATIFKDLSHLPKWLVDIDYSNGVYYLANRDKVYEFTETGNEEVLLEQTEGMIWYVAVVGKYAYCTDFNAGVIYKVDIFTGEKEVFVEGLDQPEDIEFLPVALQAP